MAITATRIDGAFSEALFDFISGHDGFQPGVYTDPRGIPMLCIGHAMLADTPGWPPCDSLERNLAAIGITLTAQDRALLIDVGEALSRQDKAAARRHVEARGFSFSLNRTQALALFERTRPDVETLLRHKLGRSLLARLCCTKELVALLSLAYDDISLIGPDLVAALQDGVREEVWYLIRFASNRSGDAKVQQRRDREASLFGLLAETPQKGERHAVAELLDSRRVVIRRYLADFCEEESAIRETIADCYRGAGLDLPPCLRQEGEVAAAVPRSRFASAERSRERCDPALID